MSVSLSAGDFLQRLEKVESDLRFGSPGQISLNEAQRKAVKMKSPLQVIASPGSGKSVVLVRRALKLMLVDTVHPKSIMMITLTNKGSSEMKKRIINQLDERLEGFGYTDVLDRNDPYIGTLHSLCLRILREYGFVDFNTLEILDDQDRMSFLREQCAFVSALAGEEDPEGWDSDIEDFETVWEFFDPVKIKDKGTRGPTKQNAAELTATLFDLLSAYRVNLSTMRESDEPALRLCGEGFERYRQKLQEIHCLDMSLLLEMFLDFLDSSDGQRFLESIPKQSSQPIKHVLIDDYEDTSPLKAEICFRLVEKLEAPNLTVVGDADQALYRFTGRMPETFIRFHSRASQRFDEPVNTVHLNHNYRSTPDIISWCNRYIREYPEMQEDGVRIQDKRPMVVARPNTGSRSDVYGLRADTAPRSAERATTLIESFRERGIIDEYSEVAFLFRTTTGGAIKQYQEKLEEHGIPVDTEWEGPRTGIGQNGVRFMTIHASKENEFPVVFADTGCKGPLTNGTYWLEEQLEPYADFTLHTDAETRAETDRVREYYVAYTRAQRKLILLDITEASEVPLGYDENGQPIAENLPSDEEILTFTPEGVTGVGDEFLH